MEMAGHLPISAPNSARTSGSSDFHTTAQPQANAPASAAEAAAGAAAPGQAQAGTNPAAAVSHGGGDDGGGGPTLVANLCANAPQLREPVLQQLHAAARAAGLKGFEVVRAVHLEGVAWSPEGGLLTPTLKLKRPALLKRYGPHIDRMYRELGDE